MQGWEADCQNRPREKAPHHRPQFVRLAESLSRLLCNSNRLLIQEFTMQSALFAAGSAKGQVRCLAEGDVLGQPVSIHSLFGIAA